MFKCSGVTVAEGFSAISHLAVTTRIAINYSRVDFFSNEFLKRCKVLSLHLDLKITFNIQYDKFSSIAQFSLVLKSNEALPKYVKQKSTPL